MTSFILDGLPCWLYHHPERVVHVITAATHTSGDMAYVGKLCSTTGMSVVNVRELSPPVKSNCWCTPCLHRIKQLNAKWGKTA